ncbi:PLP-dependent transferase [Epithele typhae]|uniref:PLP-dependent transferase n=1 Tax=Epithele typhae TaxID=378194 RepID=UPI00200823E0|nr:PLP-dependent transferase [Epithele typhae]KAH9918905.1 PLP-dependent transferase [Epithele typhae]
MSLNDKLAAALASRDRRAIRRRLPDPAADDGLVDFSTNDYLALSRSPALRARFLRQLAAAPDVLGSGGSRLLVNGRAHAALEARLAAFFRAPAALLFNSGFDANAGLFACVPQPGDALLFDEHIHASVHDGVRASRVDPAARVAFAHNSVPGLRKALGELVAARPALRTGASGVFVAVETLYSMDGTLAPLPEIVDAIDELLPAGNGHLIVDEAHATGIYGPQGRGLVAAYGLEDRVFARLHTFGKALAATGAVLLVTPLVRDYLLNYARPLIYTTALGHANVVAAECSFDALEDGTAQQLATRLLELSRYFLAALRSALATHRVPPALLSLPFHLALPSLALPPSSSSFSSSLALPSSATPIVPVLTPHPRALAAHLRARGLNARAITWPTVPKGADRVRVCLRADHSRADVERLVRAMVEWAQSWPAVEVGAVVQAKL